MTDIKMKGLITMTNEKMTYVVALNTAIAFLNDSTFDNQEVIDKLSALRDQQVARNSAKRKPTAKQIADKQARAELGEQVLDILRNSASLMTVSDICSALGGDYSTQKISAVIKTLGASVEREVDKRKAYYKIAG
jgi:uncharacterized protein YeeX (DUF496 family)